MNVACCEDGCRGIPNDNVPLFVSHLILVTLATASWILCAAVLKDDWPTHVESWLVFNLALAAAETLYGAWACVVDARDTTFFERSTRSFLIADGVFATMQLAVAVTGAAYWRGGGSSAGYVTLPVARASSRAAYMLRSASSQSFARGSTSSSSDMLT